MSGKTVRRRSPRHVLDELLLLHEQYGIRHFDFIDDNFVTRREYVQEFCEGILEADLDIEWSCAGVHLKGLTPDLLRLMERSGCRSLVVGVESGNDEILRHMRKGIRTQEIRERLEIIRECSRIMVMGQFILGYPLDTPRTIQQTIDFAQELGASSTQFAVAIPQPGSPLYQQCVENSWLIYDDWEDFASSNALIETPQLSREDAEAARIRAYREHYPHLFDMEGRLIDKDIIGDFEREASRRT